MTSSVTADRNTSLDIMRFVGLMLVVLAHCEPPAWLFQLRNFDVPLLVVASAATYAMLYQNRPLQWLPFYLKRIPRLVIPAWLFLTFFFGIAFLHSDLTDSRYPFSNREIFTSYIFYSGIGYVWVLKVFLWIALLTPPLLAFRKKIPALLPYFLILGILYILNETGVWLAAQYIHHTTLENVLEKIVFTLIPYGLLYAYGLRLQDLTPRAIGLITLFAFAIFVGMAAAFYHAHGSFMPSQAFKYPPTLYYLSYAVGALNLIYLAATKIAERVRNPSVIVTWISANSLWIYLWHILTLFIWNTVVGKADQTLLSSLPKYACVLSSACLITYVQSLVVRTALKDRTDWLSTQARALLT